MFLNCNKKKHAEFYFQTHTLQFYHVFYCSSHINRPKIIVEYYSNQTIVVLRNNMEVQ